ncbi:hypothetical protein S40285_10555 [Stachybotrys chlorohalonatus IBT 40285]|uniref:Uncharacterized protein n=1 Tax=Stachybotrys chlorohalonatus (strain IBT 40285) TaxID=1283841 RepID=A0A084QU93_STAC4|nr:hypothetical protein S40285_10555 [Stachybotrys chlorohalonata IBT 40285]
MERTNFKRAKRRSAKPGSNNDTSHPHNNVYAPMGASTDRHAKPGVPVVGVATEPHVVTLARQHGFATVQKMESEQGAQSVVRTFMTSLRDSEACVPAADFVCAMFPGAGLTTLEEEDNAQNEKIALLIEASLHEGRTVVEDDLGPLSATQLSRLHTIPEPAFTRLDHKNTSPNAELREIQDGINSWVRLSKKLSRQLSTIVAANDKFLTNSAGRFKGLGRYLSSIREIIDDLEAQNMKLTDRKSDWETLHQDLDTEHTSEAQELGNSQKRIADDSRYLSYLLIFWATPLALTLATLTLDTSFIPFVPRRSSFILVLFFVYSFMSILVLRGIRNYDYIAALSDALLGRKPWKPSDGWVTPQWARSRPQLPPDAPLERQEELHVHAGETLT